MFDRCRIGFSALVLSMVAAAAPRRRLTGVPLKGFANATVVDAQTLPSGDLQLTATESGIATCLGLFSRSEVIVVHPDGSLEGTLVFTAANGDELSADIEGGFTSATTAAGHYAITGGTGRFESATGTAEFAAATTDGVHFAITFAGTVQF